MDVIEHIGRSLEVIKNVRTFLVDESKFKHYSEMRLHNKYVVTALCSFRKYKTRSIKYKC